MASRRGHGEGAIYQRESDGKWCASVDLGFVNGKRRRKIIYGKTRKEIAEKLKALHRDQAAGINIAPLQQTVKVFLEIWLEQTVKRLNRPRTYDKYAADVKYHIIPAIGNYQLTKLTPEHVQRLLNDLADAGLSYNSVRNVRAALRRALNQAMRHGYVQRNVATLVDVPGDVTFTAEPLDEEQTRRFLEVARGHRLEALYRVALGLGLRKGEILGLLWEDVDFDAATLHVTGSLQRQNGHLERSATKTDASIRTVTLPPTLLKILRKHKARQEKERARCERWHETGYVFTSTIGTPLEPSNMIRHFKASLRKAGLPPTTRFHDLRHTCATLMIKRGVHARAVMDVLGHAQISTTMNTYAHVLEEVQREAVSALDALFPDDEDTEEDEDAEEADELSDGTDDDEEVRGLHSDRSA
jgi:integrase